MKKLKAISPINSDRIFTGADTLEFNELLINLLNEFFLVMSQLKGTSVLKNFLCIKISNTISKIKIDSIFIPNRNFMSRNVSYIQQK